MKSFFHRIKDHLFYKALLLFILMQGSSIAFAQGANPPVSGGGATFGNPLRANSLAGFIDALLDIIIKLAVPVIALFIIYAGFLMVSSRGDVSKLEKAKKTLYNTLLGAAIILGAKVISDVIITTLGSL